MPRLSRSTSVLVIALLVTLVLFIVGLLMGPLGAAFLHTKPLLPSPEVHLPSSEVFSLFGFGISNTMLASWLTIILIAALAFAATHRMKIVPGRLQGVAELVVETLLNFVRGVVGREKERLVFPIVATIFLLVIFNAWVSILPIFGPIGFMFTDQEGIHLSPLFRNANTDINLPLSIAIISFICVEYWGIRALGGFHYLSQFFNVRNLLRGRIFFGIVDLGVGFLEGLSHIIRIVSFTFRLFGNMTAGKTLLIIATFLIPFIFAIPFYGLELLIGFVQALIFAGLTLVFAAIAISPHEEEHH